MATITLQIVHLSSFGALLDCAFAIAETHGEEAAQEWARQQLRDHFDLFCKVEVVKPRPALRVIAGGRR